MQPILQPLVYVVHLVPRGTPRQQPAVYNKKDYTMPMTFASGLSFLGGFTMTAALPPENTAAWFGGGYAPSTVRSTVDRITYATDTATASVRGPLSLARYHLAAVGNTTDGWFGGGYTPSPAAACRSTVDRITYATDTATASVRGPLSVPRFAVGAAAGIQ